MTSISQNGDQLMRYGHPLHKINPSVSISHLAEKHFSESDSTHNSELFRLDAEQLNADHLPEQADHLPQSVHQQRAVGGNLSIDQRFLKFYIEGIRQYNKLNKAGTDLFEFVYEELSDSTNQGKDQLCLNYILANQWNPDLTRRTYSRGIAELLDKEFLFRSMVNDIYFVNTNFIFNGDRVALAKSYLSSTTNSPRVTN
jgi:hypothetical protein